MTEREVSSERVSEEKVRAMLAGLEGVTPGPWYIYGEPEVGLPDDVFAGASGKDMGPVWDCRHNRHHITRCDPDTMRSILTELLALRSSVKTETRVKALEWELLGDDSWRAPALFFGSFRVENYARGYIVLWSVPGIADTFVEGRWPSAEAAKAAAQADYERRVLSAIEAPAASSEVTEAARDWSSNADRQAVEAGQLAAFEYSKSGGGPIGVFTEGLRAYRAALTSALKGGLY